MIIQNYFNLENSSFVVHFTADQTGVLFFGPPGIAHINTRVDQGCSKNLRQFGTMNYITKVVPI